MAGSGPVVVNRNSTVDAPGVRTGNPYGLIDMAVLDPDQWRLYAAGHFDGLLDGLRRGYRQGWTACDTQLATLQRAAHRRTQAAARVDDHATHQQRVRERAIEAGERNRAQARDWPPETAPPHPAALFVVPTPQEAARAAGGAA